MSVFFILLWVTAARGATLFSDEFNRTGPNLGADWGVVAGSYSTNGTQAVSGSGGTSNWARVNASLGTNDYQVEAVITPPASSAYSGLVARGDAATFYSTLYALQIDAAAQKVNLYRRNAGSWTLLQGVAAPGGVAAGSPYKLKLEVTGSNPVALKVFFKDALLFSYSDSSANRVLSGPPGLENFNSGVAYDHFFVYSIDTTGNQPPQAKFSATPTSGTAPLKVAFDASTSTDPDGSITSYAWDFGDGTAGTDQIIDHTYTSAGSYTAALTVTDNDHAQASLSRVISVQSNGGQTILFQDNFNRVGSTLGTGWRLDAGSFSTDGANAVSGGTANWAAVTAPSSTSDYAVEATLTVPSGSLYSGIVARGNSKAINTDNYSLQISTAGTVNLYRRNGSVWTLLRSASAPGGIAVGTPYKIKLQVKGASPTELQVSFQDALLFAYTDSSASQLFSGLPGIENYDAGVKYNLLTVYGLSSNGNVKPTAKFSCTPTTGPAPLTVSCDASASSDPDGTIASYTWNFGDGTTGTGVTAGHTYSNSGNVTVTLVVTDNGGAQGTASTLITVTSSGGGGGTGSGWTLLHVPADLKGVHFVDQNIGWVVGLDMAIYKTTDGGKTWTKQTNIVWKGSAPAVLPWIFDVFFIDQNRGWATGWPELILQTTDGGKTWVEQHRNPISPKDNQPFNSTNFCQDFDADGNCVHVYGVYLRKIQFTPDGLTGFSVGRYRYIFKTTNGGQQWSLLPFDWKSPNFNPDPTCSNPDNPSGPPVHPHFTAYNPHLFSVVLLSATELFIVGGAAGTYDCPDWFNTIAHSADGGKTWDFKVDLDRKQRFFDVRFIGDVGWIVGGGGTILRTTDHGKNWTVMNPTRSIASTDLLGVAFPAPNQVWAVGQGGVTVHTPDGGSTWEKQDSKTTLRLERVWFIDALRGWAAGHLGAVTKTTSGGD
ncbi:MAG: PKD domain-containing protein [Nitrospirae bacterium]|nr:PKD domain-containing protein [Candidatus Manganitrophaceae bacterium]